MAKSQGKSARRGQAQKKIRATRHALGPTPGRDQPAEDEGAESLSPLPASGRGRPPEEKVLERRAEIFRRLLEYKAELQVGGHSTSEVRQLTANDIVAQGLAGTWKTARDHINEVFDAAHSLRRTEEALQVGPYPFSSSVAREWRNSSLKRQIAAKVAEIIPPGASVAVTEGSTTALCVHAILAAHKHISITTNNLYLFEPRLLEYCDVFLCGGAYHALSHATTGPEAARAFRERACQFALLTAYSVDDNCLAFVYHYEDCSVQNAAIEAETVIFACDISKFGHRSGHWAFTDLCHLGSSRPGKVIVVTNALAEKSAGKERQQKVSQIMGKLKDAGIKVYEVDSHGESVE